MIEIKNISKSYKKRQGLKNNKVKVLNHISFNIEEGKVVGILGINGVGKSTILKAIAGLITLDKGEIFIDGERLSQETYNKLAFVPDINIHFTGFSIKESFEFMEIFYKNWDKEKAKDMLERFKLDEDDIIDNLSKGNIARVKIILGFCQNAKYLLLDEPFSGIDIFTREDFIKAVTRYTQENQTIVITTHEIDEIESIVDDVVLLRENENVICFNAEELRENENKSILQKMREVYKSE